jgi:membrane fusion protein (multidrug efflux system)
MSLIPYPTTLRALEADRRGAHGVLLALAGALLGGWLAWAVGVEVPVTAESSRATIVPLAPPRVLAASADGILASRFMTLGQSVRAGELLVTLEDRDLRARLAAVAARRAAVVGGIEAIAAQRAAGRRAGDAERRAEAAAVAARERRALEAAAAAALAEEVRRREARLETAGLLAPVAAARSRGEAAERREAAAAATLGAEAGRWRGGAALAERAAAGARLDGELARLRGELAALAAEGEAGERELARRSLQAPVGGLLAEVTAAQPGALVGRGAPLATLVPDGPMGVIAFFASPAGGAIRPGQRAWMRLAAAPGGEPAAWLARVTAVAAAALPGGSWEVHLALPAVAAAGPPRVRAGEPCEIEVEIERRTPASLVLRVLGWRARGAPAGAERVRGSTAAAGEAAP